MKHGSIITPTPPGLPRLAHRATAVAAKPVNWFMKPADHDMLGNDLFGDCDPAADFRIIQLWGGLCSQALALGRYSQLTGFNAAFSYTDQGTDTNMDMRAWCRFPIFDGKDIWPIYWAQIEPADFDQISRALTRFPLLATLLLPAAVENKPELWGGAVGTGSAWAPSAAHRVVLGGWDGTDWTVESWGEYYKVSQNMLAHMLCVVDVPIPHPMSAPDMVDLAGIDFDQLTADLDRIKFT